MLVIGDIITNLSAVSSVSVPGVNLKKNEDNIKKEKKSRFSEIGH